MAVIVVRTVSTGHPGGTGLSQHCFAGNGTAAAGAVGAVRAFWDAAKVLWPNSIRYQVQSDVLEFDETTGELIGESSQPTAAGAAVQGTSPNVAYAAGVGAWVKWKTQTITNNRRIQGRTFVVPLAYDKYDSDGSLAGNVLTTLQGAADGLITQADLNGTPLNIWRRPHVPSTSDPRPGYAGRLGEVQVATIVDRCTSLRSRRY